MWKNNNLPEFGTLSGVKIVHATQSTAGPFGVQLLADYGADVIWLENALAPDITRFSRSFAIESDRKNQRNLALNIPTTEGKEILLNLLKDADVFVETSKGGQYDKWGLSDEVLWGVNPKLIIVHISGFGQTGLSEYIGRPSYDVIAQAFSGYMFSNAAPDAPPHSVGPYTADFMTAMFSAISILAALHKVQQTGVGESIDLAQYEVLMRSQQYIADWFSSHEIREQTGYPVVYAGCGSFKAKDGEYVSFFLMGAGVVKKAINFLGLEYGGELFPEGISLIYLNTEAGKKFNGAIEAYMAQKTSYEAQDELLKVGLAVSKVNSFKDLENDPQVKAREMIQEWESVKGAHVRAVGVVPKFKNYPGKVWRPAPYQGMDNEEVLDELGYSSEQVQELYQKKVIAKDDKMKIMVPWDK